MKVTATETALQLIQELKENHTSGLLKSHDKKFYDGWSVKISEELFKILNINSVFEFKNKFNDYFTDEIRIIKMRSGVRYPFHYDYKNLGHLKRKEIPKAIPRPSTINFLLSEPNNDLTRFAIDTSLTKIIMDDDLYCKDNTKKFNVIEKEPNKFYWDNEENCVVIDEFKMNKKAAIINTSTLHSVEATNDERLIVSFFMWPLHSFHSMVEILRYKNLLVEREI